MFFRVIICLSWTRALHIPSQSRLLWKNGWTYGKREKERDERFYVFLYNIITGLLPGMLERTERKRI